ncbi:hypothetical protein POM88_011302 [Heracleum sosnowskyi]|uniref:Retrotransposon gag domain-containing protein n=1 Tax=Heracleum sosnowskyi TaxID=360622 RepID=A0AAD8IWR3_9APIA|nr:hypothetical protein POM88_011302 [Heracleum sosnowskyi]
MTNGTTGKDNSTGSEGIVPPGFGINRTPPIQPRIFSLDEEEGPTPTPEEQRELIMRWREEKMAKGKGPENEKDKETERLAKRKEAYRLRLQALRLQREELESEEKALELEEKALREALETEPRREKRVRDAIDDEDESWDSESHSRRLRSKIAYTSDSGDDEGPDTQDRIRRIEKAMFGERKVSHEPVVTEEVEDFRPPPGRQFPKMSEFNAKGDPTDHCEKYEALMTGMGHCDVMLCKMFKTYLRGPASMWYRSLRPRSIGTYEQVKRKFLRHYSHLCRREKDTEALIHCRQRANEELGDYLVRFKEEAGMVTNLDKVKAAGFLAAGLDPIKGKKLRSSLYDIPPKSLNDIYVRGEAIRRKIESIGGYKERKKNDSREDRMNNSRDDRRGRGDIKSRLTDNRPDKGADRRRDRDNAVFTPLNTPISKILHEIKGKPGFVRPSRLRTPENRRNENKYCDYHRDKGHNTDECFHLKKLIEKMIKDGELTQFVGDLRDKLESMEKQKTIEGGEKYRGEVRTISGGTILNRDSKTARKKYARQVYNLHQTSTAKQPLPISFTEDDYEDVIWPHEDLLVINPVIGENKIWRVLVDGGSSVNILYHRTYLKMNLGGEQLDPCHEAPLYGFGNYPVPIEGTITLSVQLGKAPYMIKKEAKFYVVRVESPYNGILGRPALSLFQAVASVPHLKLKFPVGDGIVISGFHIHLDRPKLA